jgi:hypothetical protein
MWPFRRRDLSERLRDRIQGLRLDGDLVIDLQVALGRADMQALLDLVENSIDPLPRPEPVDGVEDLEFP